MVLRQQLCAYIDDLLQTAAFNDYCKNGMQVEGAPEIAKLATAVSASLETIEEAVKIGAQALLVHHGLFWNGDSYVISGVKRKKLALLLRHEINVLAYHLPLDAHREFGNNWKAAQEMGWKEISPFCPVNGIAIGVKGKIPKQSREDFKAFLENYYKHPAHCALGGKDVVETVGLVSGGAYKSITYAANDELDCYVTGNFDEPVWHQAYEENVNFFAMGHSATERIGPRALGEHLRDVFNIEVSFIDIPNPF